MSFNIQIGVLMTETLKFMSKIWKSGKKRYIPIPKEQVKLLEKARKSGAEFIIEITIGE